MLVRIESNESGPRLYVLGARLHHWEWGVACLAAGVYLIYVDRRDIPRPHGRLNERRPSVSRYGVEAQQA